MSRYKFFLQESYPCDHINFEKLALFGIMNQFFMGNMQRQKAKIFEMLQNFAYS